MSEKAVKETGLIITEKDLEEMDHADVLDAPLEATDPVNYVFLKVGAVIAMVSTLVMLILQLTAVTMRYFFNNSIPLAAEGPAYFFPWLICGGAIVAQAQMGHVSVDFVLTKMKDATRKIALIVVWVLATLIMGYVTYLAIYMVGPMAQQTTPIMGWSQIGSFSAFVLMALSMTVQGAIRVYYIWKSDPSDLPVKAENDGVPELKENYGG